jgi:catechol 2,3-dioxygenase-like lactoylglutathione lyase family enzyme
MPRITKITPNLVVSDVGRSVAFYRDVLGFSVAVTVPDGPPYVFAAVRSGPVQIYLNAPAAATAEYPAFTDRPIGGTFTMFIEVEGIAALHEDLAGQVRVVMPFEKKWYGVTEFAIADPDGYIITFAERSAQ